MLAVTFFRHMENIFPLSPVSHISVEKLCESYFCSLEDMVSSSGSLKTFFLFDFQQLYSDIIRYSQEHVVLSRQVS